MSDRVQRVSLALLLLAISLAGNAQDVPNVEPGDRDYSPYPERDYPDALLFGDIHVHTYYSVDAKVFGVEIPEGAPTSIQERAYTSPIWYLPE